MPLPKSRYALLNKVTDLNPSQCLNAQPSSTQGSIAVDATSSPSSQVCSLITLQPDCPNPPSQRAADTRKSPTSVVLFGSTDLRRITRTSSRRNLLSYLSKPTRACNSAQRIPSVSRRRTPGRCRLSPMDTAGQGAGGHPSPDSTASTREASALHPARLHRRPRKVVADSHSSPATARRGDCEIGSACAQPDPASASCVIDFLPHKCLPTAICLGQCQDEALAACSLLSQQRNAITKDLLEQYR